MSGLIYNSLRTFSGVVKTLGAMISATYKKKKITLNSLLIISYTFLWNLFYFGVVKTIQRIGIAN